jgi:hypothetical protein
MSKSESFPSFLAFIIILVGVIFSSSDTNAQCTEGQISIEVVILADGFPSETSWSLEYDGEILAEGGASGDTICFDASVEDPCLLFNVFDSFGDGIFDPGGYWIYQDGVELASGGDFGFDESVSFNCAPGATCNDALELSLGVVSQDASNAWYLYTPPSNGMYLLSTCDVECDTRLWIYDYCNMGNFDDTNEGSIYYDDEEGGCGEQANLTVLLEGGVPYWIRMGLGDAEYDGLVDLESSWNYLDTGEDLGTSWLDNEYDDSSWASGSAELGYGDGDEATTVSYGDDASNKHTTTYFRRSFEFNGEAGDNISGLLRLRRDDGAVVYLNGEELQRSNMPEGPISASTFASAEMLGNNESILNEYPVQLNLLNGTNVVAVEIHQLNLTSSDISFDLELLAETATGPCSEGFDWNFDFIGLPTGCMDETACNFSPFAEVDSGDCIYPGDPSCTGPDLIVNSEAIESSLSSEVMQVSETDCYIEEGCLNGYGDRELIRFTTHIENIGDLDYYIGVPSQAENNQFEWGDCHNHWHHQGYAKYDLFTMDGTVIPIGFKNGFCVMDLECSGGGTAQYGCGNMGISAGCGDIYGSGLSCQWIDVTDVEDGAYYLIVRANYDFIPDALGHAENSYENNHAAVCINLDRSSGELLVETVEGCEPFDDCTGTLFGTAQVDCNGDCNGSALLGDLDANGAQEFSDAVSYIEHILGNDIEALPCTDVDQDGEITVSDAAYLAQCQHFNTAHQHPDSSGFHDKCDFPVNHITNPFDTVHFTIGAVNWSEQYLDIHVLNPNNRIVGYQLSMSGMAIASAYNITDPLEFPITPDFIPGGEEVIGLSYNNMSFQKHYEYVPLLRLYWNSIEDEVCIDFITDVVNPEYHNTLHVIENGCVTASGVSQMVAVSAPMLYPNPLVDSSTLRYDNPSRQMLILSIRDVSGRLIREEMVSGNSHEILRGDLKTGSYIFTLSGDNILSYSGRLNIQ